VLHADNVQASFSNEDDQEDTPYMRQLFRLAKAAEIKSFMKTTADPCSNFYEFACGNYKYINPARALEVVSTGSIETLQKGFKRKLQEMLSTPQHGHDTPEDVQVKRFYESCTRLTFNTYEQQLKELISEFGSMPVLVGNFWREEDFHWLETSGRIGHRYGVSAIIEALSSDEGTVVLSPPKFILEPPADYMRERDRIAVILRRNLGVESRLAEQTARELLEFEETLGRMPEDGKSQVKAFGVEEEHQPLLDVHRLLNVTFVGVQTILVENLAYTRHLNEVIKNVPQRTVANYIFYYLVKNFLDFPWRTSPNLKKECVDLTRKHIPRSLDNMFYRRHKKAASDIKDIWHQIKDAINRTLFSPHLNWIQNSTQKTAYAKLQKMTLNLLNYEAINFTQKFEGLNLTSSNYFENLRHVKHILAVRRTSDKILDSYYSPAYILFHNKINMPVAYLQRYYFWADAYPKALKFGTLGFFIGHELVHGFSSDGLGYLDGDTYNWWDRRSHKNYMERQVCFKKQYGGYPDMETTDQTENIADNGGLSLALAAYKEWSERQKKVDGTRIHMENERLPSLNFTSKQLFFLSFAQKLCQDIDYASLAVPLTSELHASGYIRVIGTLSNLDEFSQEFNCSKGSSMNPKQKCTIY
ncbi:hypothetical protein KR059_003353, partial [Drosophila kikkawai]